jgi:DNA polymerase/3'-5' exonuclease PolX
MNQFIISGLEYHLELEKKDGNTFKIRAIQNAIYKIKKYELEIISGEYAKDNISGIGNGIAKRINTILENVKNGNSNQYLEKKEYNSKISDNELLNITGVGPAKIKKWKDQNINSIEELKKAIQENKIKITHHINIGIKYYYDFLKRIPREEVNMIENKCSKICKKINNSNKFIVCGSYRRGKKDCGDIDILITNPILKTNDDIENSSLLKIFVNELKKQKIIIDDLTNEGNKKFMGVCKVNKNGTPRRIDIRCIEYPALSCAMLYFTGSKDFNLLCRKAAIKQNLILNEYGLFKKNDKKERIYLPTEENVLKYLSIDLNYLDPTKR